MATTTTLKDLFAEKLDNFIGFWNALDTAEYPLPDNLTSGPEVAIEFLKLLGEAVGEDVLAGIIDQAPVDVIIAEVVDITQGAADMAYAKQVEDFLDAQTPEVAKKLRRYAAFFADCTVQFMEE